MSWIQPHSAGWVLQIKVVPRASRNKIQGPLGDALKIQLMAPPVEGKANAALLEFLRQTLSIPRNQIELLSGDTSRHKRVWIRGLNEAELRAKLK